MYMVKFHVRSSNKIFKSSTNASLAAHGAGIATLSPRGYAFGTETAADPSGHYV